jgi:hypothetical protein
LTIKVDVHLAQPLQVARGCGRGAMAVMEICLDRPHLRAHEANSMLQPSPNSLTGLKARGGLQAPHHETQTNPTKSQNPMGLTPSPPVVLLLTKAQTNNSVILFSKHDATDKFASSRLYDSGRGPGATVGVLYPWYPTHQTSTPNSAR